MSKKPVILGIESSCDETAVALIRENNEGEPEILSNIVSSQVDIHKEFGGVVPELAARAHIEKIDFIINMSKFGTLKEIFELFISKRKFHMFPIIILLIALMAVTTLAQSGLVAFIYPI